MHRTHQKSFSPYPDRFVDEYELYAVSRWHVVLKKANQEIRSANRRISKNNELMRMAAEMSNHTIFEYNMETRTIELKTKVSNCLFNSLVITPELVHENGCPTPQKNEFLKILRILFCAGNEQKQATNSEKCRFTVQNIWSILIIISDGEIFVLFNTKLC